MAILRTTKCSEQDAVHGSKQGSHLCTCKLGMHGDAHHCPTCNRRWGHPNWSNHPLKKTPKGI